MPGGQPNSAVTLRRDLVEMAEEIDHSELNLVADKIAPGTSVARVAGQYPVLPRETRMKVPETRRHEDGSYSRGSWDWNQDTYFCLEYGFEEPVGKVSQMEHEEFVNQEEVATELSHESLLLGRESRVASAIMNTTTFTGATNVVTITEEWDDATNAVPWSDVNSAFLILRAKCGLGKKMMSLIITDDNLDLVMRSDDVTANSKYTTDVLTLNTDRKAQWLADYLGIKEVITTSAIYDTTKLASAATIGKFWSNEYGMLCIRDTGGSLRTRGVAKQVVWTQYSNDYLMETYEEPAQNRWIVRAREHRGIKINTDYGVLLANMKTTVGAGTGI